MKKIISTLIFCVVIATHVVYSQTSLKKQSEWTEEKHYIATSVFILSSFIPNDNTFFYEIDYGYKLNSKIDLVAGANVYQYTFPMSAPWTDATEYPGTVLSYGFLAACQYYVWRNFYVDQMFNPLFLKYNNQETPSKENGFMLLLATRIGYHYDFKMFDKSFYIEVGGEISYWPVNANVPQEFKIVDDKYKSYTFSPALQFGYKF